MLKLKNAPENHHPTRRKEALRDRSRLMLKNIQETCHSAKVPIVQVVRGVAVPVAEWRIVPDGVACPRGCEFKMDMEKGTNMIRVLQPTSSGDRPCLVLTPSGNLEAPKVGNSLLKRKRVEPSSRQLPAPRRGPPICVDDSPPPQRAKTAPHSPSSSAKLSLATGKYKSVEREHRRKKVMVRKDGSREEASVQTKSREIRPKKGASGGSREKTTSRQQQGIRHLRDGRKVITETITLQRVTVLPKSPKK